MGRLEEVRAERVGTEMRVTEYLTGGIGAAQRIGLGSNLSQIRAPVGDDHLPFLDAGIPSVDIIDLNYGPDNSYHHTAADTLDKVSPESMEKVGRIVLAMLPELQK